MQALPIIVGISNVFCALVALALAIPLARRRVPMNTWYGVRFPRSFESEELWYRINEFGGRLMIRWSLLLLLIGIGSFFVRSEPLGIALAFAPLLFIVPCIQSFRYASRL